MVIVSLPQFKRLQYLNWPIMKASLIAFYWYQHLQRLTFDGWCYARKEAKRPLLSLNTGRDLWRRYGIIKLHQTSGTLMLITLIRVMPPLHRAALPLPYHKQPVSPWSSFLYFFYELESYIWGFRANGKKPGKRKEFRAQFNYIPSRLSE